MPKYFLRRSLFWLIFLVQLPLQLAMGFIGLAAAVYGGLEGVLHLANFRLECWAHGVPKGHFHNCPWRWGYAKAWKDGFRG
jgi:hypothetical protein